MLRVSGELHRYGTVIIHRDAVAPSEPVVHFAIEPRLVLDLHSNSAGWGEVLMIAGTTMDQTGMQDKYPRRQLVRKLISI
jgi:hypothetical protein